MISPKNVNYRPAIDLLELTMARARMPEAVWDELAVAWSSWRAREAVAKSLLAKFANDPDVLVLNDLEFLRNEDVHTLDHLIITPRNLYAIDSSTICTSVNVMPNGNWQRKTGSGNAELPPPLPALEESVDALIQILRRHTARFLPNSGEKTWGRFDKALTRHNFITVASAADVEGWKLKSYKGVLVSAEKIAQLIADNEELTKPAFMDKFLGRVTHEQQQALNRNSLMKLRDLLARQDRAGSPVRRAAKRLHELLDPMPAALNEAIENVLQQTTRDPTSRTAAFDALVLIHYCPHCQSNKLWLKAALDRFWFVCEDCGRPSEINMRCPKCRAVGYLTQSNRTFALTCIDCGYDDTFFVNHELERKCHRHHQQVDSVPLAHSYAG